ncbi:ATP-binding protein [Streptomyces virginiae]|uniref:ATP-binding protein n=1 Tax=Streptomyces virginiae TaxID=1961 RepID=UPI0034374BA7
MEELSGPLGAPAKGDVTGAEARASARRVLDRLKPPVSAERREDVLSVVSELIANARLHGGGVTDFDVRFHLGALVVEVSDRSPCAPRTSPWMPAQPGGFGWRLVKQLADRAHVRFHDGGKTVNATFFLGPSRFPRPATGMP